MEKISLSLCSLNPFKHERHLNKAGNYNFKKRINMDSKDAMVVFEGTKIRRIWHDEQWFFSVIDIIETLTDSPTPRQYWGKIKDREFAQLELSPIWVRLKLPAEDGKLRFTDCINTQNEDEWKERGVDQNLEYAMLTNEISKAIFGKTVDEYKNYKKLKKENLRDHMTDLELIFTMLGEKVTTEITKSKEAKNFSECKRAAKEGGGVAGNARHDAEKKIGKPVISKENYLVEPEKVKRKRLQ